MKWIPGLNPRFENRSRPENEKNSGVEKPGPSQAGGGGPVPPPHFLADQLTLSQPGGHIIPTQYYVPPQIFRPCDGPGITVSPPESRKYKINIW